MKKISLIIILSLIGCNSGANKMIISGNIEGLKKGTLYLPERAKRYAIPLGFSK